MIRRHCWAIGGLLFFLVSTAAGARGQRDQVDLSEMKKEIELFESVLNQSLTQTFGGPFDTLSRAQGAYLPGYGVVFSFEVNLSPMRNWGPFSAGAVAKSTEEQLQEENRRRERAKAVADQVLANFGQTLTQLVPGESVTIIIHTAAARPNKIERSTIVVSAEKKLIEERQAKLIDQANFVRKLRTTEY